MKKFTQRMNVGDCYEKSILAVLFSLSLLVGCLLASPTCLHCVLPCFAPSCYRPCSAFAVLSRTVGLSMPCLTSSKCSNLEKDDTLSIENILAKALLDSPNKKEKKITTVNPLASSTWEKEANKSGNN
ncbi:hypothetical protein HN51_066427 [Arachis hypogaea]|uniref:Uncharacterized protein n=1 Tax=Arachis hypogaea TaxID=3818 RepID=A0A444ZNW2_ARAHY|nr:uncharacterized protein LOC112743558 [Arachis hypogaea]XP_029147978.1 uncharacterized protein LOC112743558 [Arachis hypogaea]RYR15802.1 hypothetical protein Ahy_B04g072742 [Arachis hypogaea]